MIKNNIDKCKIEKRVLIRDRWHVELNPKLNGKKRIPMAHYIWLLNNPYFLDVPPGYVIHHLDGDKLNDDISNLALMDKNSHMVYHAKSYNKIEYDLGVYISGDIYSLSKSNEIFVGENITPPKIMYLKDRGAYAVRWIDTFMGERRKRHIGKYKGKLIKTKSDAQKIVDYIIKKAEITV